MQYGRRRLQISTVVDENGNPCTTLEAQQTMEEALHQDFDYPDNRMQRHCPIRCCWEKSCKNYSRKVAGAEEELLESECGFRKNRGCPDMVFIVHQLVKKSWNTEQRLLVFIDLKKAYNFIPHETLWIVLRKFGVLESMLIRSFHSDMQAQIRLHNATLEPNDINNGSQQGCPMAPHSLTSTCTQLWNDGMQG